MELEPNIRLVLQDREKAELLKKSQELTVCREELGKQIEALNTQIENLAEPVGARMEELIWQRDELAQQEKELKEQLEEIERKVEAVSEAQFTQLAQQTEEIDELIGGRFALEPAGYLLSNIGLILLLAGLALAIWFGQGIVTVLLGLVLSAAGLSKLWSRLSLVGVSCSRHLSDKRVFPGEYIELKLRVSNRKPLPLPWLQVEDEVPTLLTSEITTAGESHRGFSLLSNATPMLWYTSATWNYRLSCPKRGFYTLGPITITSGDILGFYPRSEYQRTLDYVIVYPKLYPVFELGQSALYPLGETRAERYIFEDPTRAIGVRDYTLQDSLRHVHWKASARQQKLEVKVFEPTTTLKVAIFLAVDSFFRDGARSEDDLEFGISAAASIARYIIDKKSQVGLFVNARLVDSPEPVRIMPGRNASHLVNMLEALAKVTSFSTCRLEEFLNNERRGLPWGTTVILIIQKPTEYLASLSSELKEHGYKLLVLRVGGEEEFVPVSLSCHVKGPDDLQRINFGGAE